jgi:hypothetical protein
MKNRWKINKVEKAQLREEINGFIKFELCSVRVYILN